MRDILHTPSELARDRPIGMKQANCRRSPKSFLAEIHRHSIGQLCTGGGCRRGIQRVQSQRAFLFRSISWRFRWKVSQLQIDGTMESAHFAWLSHQNRPLRISKVPSWSTTALTEVGAHTRTNTNGSNAEDDHNERHH